MIRILHIITSLKTGGAEHLMVDLLPELINLGNDVELLIFNGSKTPFYDTLIKKGIKIHDFGVGVNVYNPVIIFKLIKFMRRYDIIHTHNTACQLFAPLSRILAFSKVKLVTTEHSTSNRRRNKSFLRWIDKLMYKQYKSIICISKKTELSLKSYLKNLDNTIVINNGIVINNYIRQVQLIENKKTFTIIMVAGFRYEKDQETLIKAISLLSDNYKLLLVGDGVRRHFCERLVDNLGVSNKVKFLGIRNDIPKILSTSDLYVQSSHIEAFGLAVVEAMAAGKPVLASNIDGLREVVGNPELLFTVENHVELADKIEKICLNPEMYRTLAIKCQERSKMFDINIMAEKYNNEYKRILK